MNPQALRNEPRTIISVQLGVATMAWDGFVSLVTKDASPGGVFFLFSQRVVPVSGSKATIQIEGEKVEAQVAHVMSARLAAATSADAGFGVCFLKRLAADWWVPLVPAAANAAPGVAPAAPVAPAPAVEPARAPQLPTPKELEAARALNAAGQELLRAHGFGAARKKFELAARISPDPQYLAMPLVCNGFQFLRLGVLDQARQAFQRALLLSSQCPEAQDGLNQVMAALKQP